MLGSLETSFMHTVAYSISIVLIFAILRTRILLLLLYMEKSFEITKVQAGYMYLKVGMKCIDEELPVVL